MNEYRFKHFCAKDLQIDVLILFLTQRLHWSWSRVNPEYDIWSIWFFMIAFLIRTVMCKLDLRKSVQGVCKKRKGDFKAGEY